MEISILINIKNSKKLKAVLQRVTVFYENLYTIILPVGKMGFRDNSLNGKNGVKTPSWRILGIKKCSQNSEQNINKFIINLIGKN